MADVAPNSYENLTHSRMLTAYAKDNKEASLTVGVYGGNTSFSIFNGTGGRPVWSQNVARATLFQLGALIDLMIANVTQCRFPIVINEWDNENRRFNKAAEFALGIDETNHVCIDIASDKISGGQNRFIFQIKPNAKFDFTNTPLNEKSHIVATLTFLKDLFLNRTGQAEVATSFKRQPGGGGGGNRGGGGGQSKWNNNSGGGNSGGGNGGGWNNNRGGGSQGGGGFNTGNGNSAVTIDDGDIPI